MYQTVIFDLDGTLLDTLDDLADSVNHVLKAHGFPARSRDEIRTFVGNGVADLIRRAVPAGTSVELESRCLGEFKAWYREHMRDRTRPYPGVRELLQALRDKGCKVAVVSNKFDGAVKNLCRDYFGDLLPVAIGEREGIRKKPAPDMLKACFKELGVDRAGAVYVGDSDTDIQTAQNALLPCLSVSWGFRDAAFLRAHGAAAVFETPEELLAEVLKD